ncbi:MAG TPA: SirB2 family protein [Steroidobacteraceae bacterium]|nr:SirB2 family protein [Steroidobacteraceae bacterium]
MSAYHAVIRSLHITCLFVSLALFVIRYLLNVRGVAWQKWRALKIMPHVVDTLLLASGFMLAYDIGQYPFTNAWLTVKFVALIVYIVLGTIALKRGKTAGIRRMAFLGAAIVFVFMISVARSHNPLGIFAQF